MHARPERVNKRNRRTAFGGNERSGIHRRIESRRGAEARVRGVRLGYFGGNRVWKILSDRQRGLGKKETPGRIGLTRLTRMRRSHVRALAFPCDSRFEDDPRLVLVRPIRPYQLLRVRRCVPMSKRIKPAPGGPRESPFNSGSESRLVVVHARTQGRTYRGCLRPCEHNLT